MQKIAIIGSGLNGLAVAFGLRKFNAQITIFEEKLFGGEYKNDFRTSFITHKSLNFFEDFRADISENSGFIEYIYSYKNSEDAIVELAGENLGFVVDNSFLKEKLINCIQNSAVVIRENTIVESVENTIDGVKINGEEFDFVICASGVNSSVHKILGIEQKNISYNQTAFICDIKHANEHKNIAVESFDKTCILAILPKKNHNISSVILTIKDEFSHQISEENLLEFLRETAWRVRHIGEITEITTKICKYPLKTRFTKKQLHGKVFFIGDSFHSVHPVLGQGFNMALKDTIKFCESFGKSQELGIPFVQYLEKLPVQNVINHLKIGVATHIFGKEFISEKPVPKFLTSCAIRVGSVIPSTIKTRILQKLL